MLVFFALVGTAKMPDASSFASQWNIGLNLQLSNSANFLTFVCAYQEEGVDLLAVQGLEERD